MPPTRAGVPGRPSPKQPQLLHLCAQPRPLLSVRRVNRVLVRHHMEPELLLHVWSRARLQQFERMLPQVVVVLVPFKFAEVLIRPNTAPLDRLPRRPPVRLHRVRRLVLLLLTEPRPPVDLDVCALDLGRDLPTFTFPCTFPIPRVSVENAASLP